MTILITTANFPDVMLPSYKKNYWSWVFFVSFLIGGLYVMMNFLLATVYNSFKSRIERKHVITREKTHVLLKKAFDNFDEEKKGHLTYTQAKDFFATVFDQDMKKKQVFEAVKDVLKEN